MVHPSNEVQQAIVKLSDALCQWERSTGRQSILILREQGGFVYRAVSGKPEIAASLSDSDILKNLDERCGQCESLDCPNCGADPCYATECKFMSGEKDRRKAIEEAAKATDYGFAASREDLNKFLIDFAIEQVNAALEESLKVLEDNYETGSLGSIADQIRALKVEPMSAEIKVHGCCGCSCAVCANGHSSGVHSEACAERMFGQNNHDQ